jgi:hypothetical protein
MLGTMTDLHGFIEILGRDGLVAKSLELFRG